MPAIQADYRTNKHIPSRKCYQLIMEVPEENFPEVCKVLGYPTTGESTYVGIALLSNETYNKPSVVVQQNIQQSEGERLRTRAVMLCKDIGFHKFMMGKNCLSSIEGMDEITVSRQLKAYCGIESRSELATNPEAQTKFKELLAKFDSWKLEQQYQHNLKGD